jgi:hypothetical protein
VEGLLVFVKITVGDVVRMQWWWVKNLGLETSAQIANAFSLPPRLLINNKMD